MVTTLDDKETQAVLKREAKQRHQSIEAYKSASRADLVEAEQKELVVIDAYLPQAMEESELQELVKATITELHVTDPKQTGQVIAKVLQVAAGRADGAQVAKLVQSELMG